MNKLFEVGLMILMMTLPFHNLIASVSYQGPNDVPVGKTASKLAKKYKKEGWKVSVGAQPLEVQFEQAWKREFEVDSEGFPIYLSVTVSAKGIDYDEARFMALELAKIRIADNLTSYVETVVDMNIINKEVSLKDVQSDVEIVETAKMNTLNRIEKLEVLWECWRKVEDDGYEVRMSVIMPVDGIRNEINSEGNE